MTAPPDLARAERLADQAVETLFRAFVTRVMQTEDGRKLLDRVIASVIAGEEPQHKRAK